MAAFVNHKNPAGEPAGCSDTFKKMYKTGNCDFSLIGSCLIMVISTVGKEIFVNIDWLPISMVV
jgi:hypothetical protein